MSALVIMFVSGYVFHLIYKVFDKVFLNIIESVRKKKGSEVV